MGNTTPVIKPAALSDTRKRTEPKSSSASPNLFIGVAARILPVRGVGVPSAFHKSAAFCFVEKNPGAIAFTLIFILEKCTASHCVKLDTAAFAPLYAGILVSGVYAFILEILSTLQPFLPSISLANSCVGSKVPRKLRLKTNSTPVSSKSKNDLVSASISPFS